MAQAERRWGYTLAWINLGSIGVILLLAAAQRPSGSAMLRMCACALLFANVCGIPGMFLLPPLLEKLTLRKYSLAAGVVLGAIVLVVVGCLAAQALLTLAGFASQRFFWRDYLDTLRIAVGLTVVFSLGAFSYDSLRQRIREKELAEERALKLAAEARLQSLESRLHPHFLFNTLNTISSLIPVDPAQAEQVVGRLAALLRASLDTGSQSLIPLQQELAMVQDYIQIENVRFAGKLHSQITLPDALRDARVPPFSIQVLVENAVKHGISPQKGGGELSLNASAENGKLRIQVCDTGSGFDLSQVRAGHALDNLTARLDTLYGSQASLSASRENGHCIVEMVLPRS